jgi:uncharacterized protein
MKQKLIFLGAIFLIISTSMAGVSEAVAAMTKRLPQLVALKKTKALGENNKGFITVLKASADASSIAAAENKDRGVVYSSIAKKHGISTAQVGKQRAKGIHKKAASGTMIQDAGGSWKAK